MNEETTQALDKIADKIIQKVTQDFTEKLEVVRSELTKKIEDKVEGVKVELTKKIEESNEKLSQKLNEKMDTGFEMMHTQITTVEENITMRVQGLENRMDNEANFRADNYVKREEHKKLVERVGVLEGTLKLA